MTSPDQRQQIYASTSCNGDSRGRGNFSSNGFFIPHAVQMHATSLSSFPIPYAMGQYFPNPPQSAQFDPRDVEIKTHSLERTLLPLVNQISTLVNFKATSIVGGKLKSEKAIRAALKIGNAIEASVERFVSVGETIADENPDIQPELYEACHAAREAGASIASLHSSSIVESEKMEGLEVGGAKAHVIKVDKSQLVKAARLLLTSVTKVLLLADRILVKHILRSEDKIAYTLTKLEHTTSFTEFVKIFTEFGQQMVDLAHRSGDRQVDLKSEKRKAQMQVARNCLERYTMLLLTTSKALLRHPDDLSARQCRDGVFNRLRSALQLIGICITDGVMPFNPQQYSIQSQSSFEEVLQNKDGPLDISFQLTINVAIKQLSGMLEMIRMMSLIGSGVQERFITFMNSLEEMIKDFTESPNTPGPQRAQTVNIVNECQIEMHKLLNPQHGSTNEKLRAESIQITVENLNQRLKDLRKQLQIIATEQINNVFCLNADHIIISNIKTCSLAGDIDGVEKFLGEFHEHAIAIQQVCRLLHHVSPTDALHVYTGHCEKNLRSLAPLLLLAGRTLCLHPSSRIGRENLEVFCDAWASNVNDLSKISKELDAACSGRLAAEKQAYMSLPKPGRHGTMQKPPKPIMLDVEDQQKMAKVGLEMKLLYDEVGAEAEKWDEYAENAIVKEAKLMSTMAYNMYLFTKGQGPLRTTHDLFTQAEFFAEKANKLHKVVGQFGYEVPSSAEKNQLLQILEKIPTHCNQLQLLVKTPTVGKALTFEKVDIVISETKSLMNQIAKLVTTSFLCSTRFNIEFRGSVSNPAIAQDGTEYYSQRTSRESSAWRRLPMLVKFT